MNSLLWWIVFLFEDYAPQKVLGSFTEIVINDLAMIIVVIFTSPFKCTYYMELYDFLYPFHNIKLFAIYTFVSLAWYNIPFILGVKIGFGIVTNTS